MCWPYNLADELSDYYCNIIPCDNSKKLQVLVLLKPFRAFLKPFEQRVNKRNPSVKLRVLLSVNLRLCLAVASQRTCEEKLEHVYLQLVWRCLIRSEMMLKVTIQSDTPRQMRFSIVTDINKTLCKFACIH